MPHLDYPPYEDKQKEDMSDAINQMSKDTEFQQRFEQVRQELKGSQNLISAPWGKTREDSPFPKEFEHTNKNEGMRFNDGKLKWSYVHFGSLEPMVKVLMFGAQKYEPFNWQKGLKKDEILESMQRHLAKMFDGEKNDPESGLSHIGHIMCNAMFWSYMDMKEEKKPIIGFGIDQK